jgi:hypothetical protein
MNMSSEGPYVLDVLVGSSNGRYANPYAATSAPRPTGVAVNRRRPSYTNIFVGSSSGLGATGVGSATM